RIVLVDRGLIAPARRIRDRLLLHRGDCARVPRQRVGALGIPDVPASARRHAGDESRAAEPRQSTKTPTSPLSATKPHIDDCHLGRFHLLMVDATHVVLPGSERRPMHGFRAVAPSPREEWVELGLKLRRKERLPDVATRPARAMTRKELAETYGASPED